MAVVYDVRNAKTLGDLKKKEDNFLNMLKLQSKLNQQYEEAMKEYTEGIKLDIKQVPPERRSVAEEQNDLIFQKQTAFTNAKSIMRDDEAQKFVANIRIERAQIFNNNFADIAKRLEGRKDTLTANFLNNFLDRYEILLAQTATGGPGTETGIILPIQQGDLQTNIENIKRELKRSYGHTTGITIGKINELGKLIKDIGEEIKDTSNDERLGLYQKFVNIVEIFAENVNKKNQLLLKNVLENLPEIKKELEGKAKPGNFFATLFGTKPSLLPMVTPEGEAIPLEESLPEGGGKDIKSKYVGEKPSGDYPMYQQFDLLTIEQINKLTNNGTTNKKELQRYLSTSNVEEYKSIEDKRKLNTKDLYDIAISRLGKSTGEEEEEKEKGEGTGYWDFIGREVEPPLLEGLFGEEEEVGRGLHHHYDKIRIGHGYIMKPRHRRVVGKGIEPSGNEKYRQFGKLIIHIPSLKKGILNIKFKSMASIPKFPQSYISQNCIDLLFELLDQHHLNHNQFNRLNQKEKKLLMECFTFADLDDVLGIKPQIDEDYRRQLKEFQILRGQVIAGNNAEQLLHQLESYIKTFMEQGNLSKQEGMEILKEIHAIV